MRRTAQAADAWEDVRSKAVDALKGGKCRVEAAELSPDGQHLAVCTEVKSMLGFRVQHAAMLYSMERKAIVGRVTIGKRDRAGWRI